MYIMYGIQGYIARTVNHDQKVPKHWREIEDERGKRNVMQKRSLDILLRIVHARSITSDSTITRTRCMSIHTHARVTYTCINGTHVRVHTMNMHIHKKREKKRRRMKKTRQFSYHYSSSCTSFLILTHALTRFWIKHSFLAVRERDRGFTNTGIEI